MKRSNHFKRFHVFAIGCICCIFTLLFYLGTLAPFASLYKSKESITPGMSHIRHGVTKEFYSIHKGTPLHTIVTAKESYITKGADGLKESLIEIDGEIEEISTDGSLLTRKISSPCGFLNYSDRTLFASHLNFFLEEKGKPLFSGNAKKALITFSDSPNFTAETVEGDGLYAP